MLKNWLIVACAFDVRRHKIPVVLCQLPPLPPPFISRHLVVLFARRCQRKESQLQKYLQAFVSHTTRWMSVRMCECVCVFAQCWKLSRLALKSFFANIATARSLARFKPFAIEIVERVVVLVVLRCCCCCCCCFCPKTAFRKCAHLSICQLLYNY